MHTVFLSHAHQDDSLARTLHAWLKDKGFTDIFADFDSIRGGDKWRDALRQAQSHCRIVVFLVTPNWLNSSECEGEFLAAWYAGKRLIPLLCVGDASLDDAQQRRLRRALGEDQGFDLTRAMLGGPLDLDGAPQIAGPLEQGLKAGGALRKVGLDPNAFEIDKNAGVARDGKYPFPGLESFRDEEADAAIFFGRSQEIAECLEDLRQMRAKGERRAYAIIGASGSGKSSLMKAGVATRLRLERSWLVLRCFRAGADPMFNFADAIRRTYDDHKLGKDSAGSIRDRLLDAWREIPKQGTDDPSPGSATEDGLVRLSAALSAEIGPLKEASGRAGATTLVLIDQGDDLLHIEDERGNALSDYLKAALVAPAAEGETLPFAVMFTARLDTLTQLQNAKRYSALNPKTATIGTLPVYRFDDAIEKPAERFGVEIDPLLVRALMNDAGGEQALPLLAFTLQRLWQEYKHEKRILRSHYDRVGKLSGIIDDAAERALRRMDPSNTQAPVDPSFPADEDKRASRVFVPQLARVNESGGAIRKIARYDGFDKAGQSLLENFKSWRLVVLDGDMIEVAHEAMFKAWKRFQVWLSSEQQRMETLRGLEAAAKAWSDRGKSPDDLIHRGKRLSEAKALQRVPDYKKQLDDNPAINAYLHASGAAYRRERVIAIAGLAAVAIVAVLFANGLNETKTWRNAMAGEARAKVDGRQPFEAATFALAAINLGRSLHPAIGSNADAWLEPMWGGSWKSYNSYSFVGKYRFVLGRRGYLDVSPYMTKGEVKFIPRVERYQTSGNGASLITANTDRSGSYYDLKGYGEGKTFSPVPLGPMLSFELSEDGSALLKREGKPGYPGNFSYYRLGRGEAVKSELPGLLTSASMSPDGQLIVAWRANGTGVLFDMTSRGAHRELAGVQRNAQDPRVNFASSGSAFFVMQNDRSTTLFNGLDAWKPQALGKLQAVAFTADGTRLVTMQCRELAPDGSCASPSDGKPQAAPGEANLDVVAIHNLRNRGESLQMSARLPREWEKNPEFLHGVLSADGILFAQDVAGSGFLYDLKHFSTPVALGQMGDLALVEFSPDGAFLIAIPQSDPRFKPSAKLYFVNERKNPIDLGQLESFKFSKNSKILFAQETNSVGWIYDLSAGGRKKELARLGRLSKDVGVVLSDDGSVLVSSKDDGSSFIYDLTQPVTRAGISPYAIGTIKAARAENGPGRPVFGLSPEGARLMISLEDGALVSRNWKSREKDYRRDNVADAICSRSSDTILPFSAQERRTFTVLQGRPWHPCDWRGLGDFPEGWAQLWRLVGVRQHWLKDYECQDLGALDKRRPLDPVIKSRTDQAQQTKEMREQRDAEIRNARNMTCLQSLRRT